MSDQPNDTEKLNTNWDALYAAPGHEYKNGQVTIELKPWNVSLYQDFDIGCPGKNSNRPCNGHINMHYGFNPAHVTGCCTDQPGGAWNRSGVGGGL